MNVGTRTQILLQMVISGQIPPEAAAALIIQGRYNYKHCAVFTPYSRTDIFADIKASAKNAHADQQRLLQHLQELAKTGDREVFLNAYDVDIESKTY